MKKFFLWLSILLIVIAAVATVWLLGLQRQFRALVDFGKTTQESYVALAKEYPTDPTDRADSSDTTAATSRWDDFVKVRSRAIAAIPAGFDRRAHEIFALRKPGLGGQMQFLLDLAPELRPVVQAHQSGLREARMSPLEYRRRLGCAMLAAIDASDRYPAGKSYRALAQQITQFARRLAENAKSNVRPDRISDPAHALQTLRKEFGSYPVAPPEAVARLETSRETAYLLDILVVAVEPEQLGNPPAAHR